MRATPGHRSRAGDGAAPGDPFCAVVALRDGHHRDLAPDVARRLGADGDVPVTVVDIVSPGRDRWPEDDGSRGRPAIGEIAVGLAGRDGVLVVIDAHGGGPIAGPLFDDSAEHLLTHTGQPILVLGPGVGRPSGQRSLLVPVDSSGRADDVLDVTVRWCATFGSAPVTVLGLDVPDPWPDESSGPVADAPRQAAARLRRRGLDVDLVRRPALDTAAVLLDASAAVAGAVLVVPGARSPGSDGHWYATARRLVRMAPCPVLVVPAQRARTVS
jgi:nucleotide-binding universal stress UspA family protein